MNPAQESKSMVQVMEWLEKYGYVTAGLSFLVLGMLVFVYGWFEFFQQVGEGLPVAVLVLMNDLLLVVIFLELFRTVINFLKTRSISLEPFLHVGIIAAVRRILTIGAQMAISTDLAHEAMQFLLIDIAVNAGVILALVIGVYLNRLPRGRSAQTGE